MKDAKDKTVDAWLVSFVTLPDGANVVRLTPSGTSASTSKPMDVVYDEVLFGMRSKRFRIVDAAKYDKDRVHIYLI